MASTSHGIKRVTGARRRTDVETHAPPRTVRIPIDRCRLHPANVRDVGDLRDLAESLDTEGMEQLITVQKHDGGRWYEVVDGGRRFLALKLSGRRKTIDALVRPPRPHDEVLLATIGTDIHKKPMTAAERGQKVQELCDKHGWGKDDIAQYLGVSPSTVYNWTAQARDSSPTGPAAVSASATSTPGQGRCSPRAGRKGRTAPVSKTQIAALRRRWETQIGEHGLDHAQAHALLADLDELVGPQEANQPETEPTAVSS